jgi:hypothetical protein
MFMSRINCERHQQRGKDIIETIIKGLGQQATPANISFVTQWAERYAGWFENSSSINSSEEKEYLKSLLKED